MGLLSAALSISWLLHIILYIFVDPPADQFLNKYFMDLDAFFALFGVATCVPVHDALRRVPSAARALPLPILVSCQVCHLRLLPSLLRH